MNRTVTILLSLVLLGLASFKATYNIEGTTDIGFFDESGYLESGFELLENPVMDGLLYRGLYLFFHLLGVPPAQAYFGQLRLLIILVGLGIFFAMWRSGYSSILAASLAAVLLGSNGVQNAWPHITRLSIFLIYLTLSIPGSRAISWKKSNVWLLLGALLLCYVRPEFVLTVALLSLSQLAYEPARPRTWIAIALGATLFLFLSPLSEGRGMVAFHQHYLYAKSVDGTFSGNPWTDSTGAFAAVFGPANSLFQACLNNPSAFAEHVLGNVKRLPMSVANILRISGASTVLLTLGLLLVLYRFRIRSITRYRIIAVGAFVFPSLFFSLLFFPRDHYLIQALIPALLLLPGFERRSPGSSEGSIPQFLGALILLYALPWRGVPGAEKTGFQPPEKKSVHESGCSNLANLRKLEGILQTRDYLLAPNDTYHVYLPSQGWNGTLTDSGFQSAKNTSEPSRPDSVFLMGSEARSAEARVTLLKTMGYDESRIDACGSVLFSRRR